MNESYEIRFAEFIGVRAYEFIDYVDGVGFWMSEDDVIETTESLYESFLNIQESIKEQDSQELIKS